ncbi:hypothetical protein ACFQVD_00840 [Streptosporangium amethystogenes subsp. fukuiense]|uniref:Uncharacterized protein n=1 Tax=Streptosporangium amethystogenes subsp. fukuiense TaxID=698418 RepID=A0ABW2SSP0_9ACTN
MIKDSMGPSNPFSILNTEVTELDGDIRRAEITYPDGVEIALRFPVPALMDPLRMVGITPAYTPLIHMATDEEEDGQTYGYVSYWVPEATV